MTYRTASEHPILAVGRGSNVVYARHGIYASTAHARRRLGILATVAESFAGTAAEAQIDWLARTFSVTGLRALAERRMTDRDVSVLQDLASENLSTLRGYVSKTRLRVHEIEVLMRDIKIPCQRVLEWTRRLPRDHQNTNLVTVLTTARIVHHVPVEDLDGWVRYANTFAVVFEGANTWPWTFLGGHTALFAAAGYTPREATRATRAGTIDVAALSMLAGLRAGAAR